MCIELCRVVGPGKGDELRLDTRGEIGYTFRRGFGVIGGLIFTFFVKHFRLG